MVLLSTVTLWDACNLLFQWLNTSQTLVVSDLFFTGSLLFSSWQLLPVSLVR
jgi:hypothetical protein